MPAVSVIMATFNHAAYLGHAVQSVLGQELTDWELLVIDDGSTDRTPAVLADLHAAHPGRFRSVRQDNVGVGGAMNRGLAETSAPLLAFLDSDDAWAADHLSTLVPMLQAEPQTIVAFGRRDVIDEKGRRISRSSKPFYSGRITTELFRSMFISKICLVVRRDVVDRAGRFDAAMRMGEDYELLLRLSRLGDFRGADLIVAHRRRHRTNLTADTSAYRVRTAALLERFYLKLDGWRDVDAVIARRRLGRVHYSAGRKLLAAGDARAARFHLARSAAFAPHVKTRALQVVAVLGSPLARRTVSPPLPDGYEFVPTEDAVDMLARVSAGHPPGPKARPRRASGPGGLRPGGTGGEIGDDAR